MLGRAFAVATLAVAVLAPPAGAAIAPDVAHSPNAEDIRTTYWVMLLVALAIGIPLLGGLLYAARRFRAGGGDAAPRRLAAGRGSVGRVTAALSAAALGIFVFGIVMTEKTRDASAGDGAEEIDVDVIGQQWVWRFEYPAQAGTASEGVATVFSYSELVVPVDTTVNLSIDSTDVLHTWFVPALGPQVMAVPGEIAETFFRADEEGLYEGQSTEYSGTGTPALRARVRVVSKDEYEAYIEELGSGLAAGQSAVQEELEANPVNGAEPVGPQTGGAGRPEEGE